LSAKLALRDCSILILVLNSLSIKYHVHDVMSDVL